MGLYFPSTVYQRPPEFAFNPNSLLSQGLLYALVGRLRGTARPVDSSRFNRHPDFVNMDATTDWIFDPQLRRPVMDFDGSNDRVVATLPHKIVWPDPWTLSCWLKKTNLTAAKAFAGFGTGGSPDFEVTATTGNLTIYWGGYKNSGFNLSADTWTHVAILVVNNDITWYKDGVKDSTAPQTFGNWAPNDGLAIGDYSTTATGYPWNGQITDVLLHRRLLLPVEIKALANPANVMLSDLLVPCGQAIWCAPLTVSIEGTTCWGHSTGAVETNKLTFANNWTGTGAISGSGDAEKIVLDDGEYMESDETIHTGAVTVTLVLNKYGGGDTVTLKYRHGATDAAARAASWNTYSTPFSSDGYVQLRVEN